MAKSTLKANWHNKEYLTMSDVMKIFDISRPTAMSIIMQIPYFRIGKMYRVRTEHVERYITTQEGANA